VQATRRFVRRQRSWFRRDQRIVWLDGAAGDLAGRALAVATATGKGATGKGAAGTRAAGAS
jgi:tRNA dimethylallyltransferase